MQDKNILITIGYSFSDEHINNLVYQALTIPSFRIVIFGNLDNPKIKELYDLDDPRIWIIGGEEEKISYHYFQHIVEKVLPNIEDQQKIEDSVKNVLKKFLN